MITESYHTCLNSTPPPIYHVRKCQKSQPAGEKEHPNDKYPHSKSFMKNQQTAHWRAWNAHESFEKVSKWALVPSALSRIALHKEKCQFYGKHYCGSFCGEQYGKTEDFLGVQQNTCILFTVLQDVWGMSRWQLQSREFIFSTSMTAITINLCSRPYSGTGQDQGREGFYQLWLLHIRNVDTCWE